MTKRRKYVVGVEGKDGWTDWFSPRKDYRQICCDCGLVHEFQFKVLDGHMIVFRARRNMRSTAALRRGGKFK